MKRGGSNKGKVAMHKENLRIYVDPNDIDKYINEGYNMGYGELFKSHMKITNNARKNPGKANDEKTELERRRKISQTMKSNPNAGGKRHGSGRGKKGWYKGIFCDSSWELAFVVYCIEHNISISRCNEKRIYTYNGQQHTYIPDFIVEGKIVEIKGYKSQQWLVKYEQNPDIEVLYEKDMKKYIDYAINKYSKDYIFLYEKDGYTNG